MIDGDLVTNFYFTVDCKPVERECRRHGMLFPRTARILFGHLSSAVWTFRGIGYACCEGAIYCFHFFERFTSRYEENQTNSTAGEENPFGGLYQLRRFSLHAVFLYVHGSHTVLKTFPSGNDTFLYPSSLER